MIELQEQSGLPLRWDPAKHSMEFFAPLQPVEPAVRRRVDMQEVLYDPRADGPQELYYMYRGISLPRDTEEVERAGLRYDVTVLVPGQIGTEPVKTAGHYHPPQKGTPFTYPEIYEVLSGTAHYLLQRKNEQEEGRIEEVLLIEAHPGDKVLIPPGFGHITINPTSEYLAMSNWVAAEFSSDYGPIRRFGGGAYFELWGQKGTEYIPNKNYQSVPPLRFLNPGEHTPLGLTRDITLYEMFHREREQLQCLVQPENFATEFERYREAWKDKAYR